MQAVATGAASDNTIAGQFAIASTGILACLRGSLGTSTDRALVAMIWSLAGDTTKDIWNGVNSKAARRIPRAIWPVIQRKLDQIDAVTTLDDLRIPPGSRLYGLVDTFAGFHAIRVSDQYRSSFRFEGERAFDVRCTDYR